MSASNTIFLFDTSVETKKKHNETSKYINRVYISSMGIRKTNFVTAAFDLKYLKDKDTGIFSDVLKNIQS